jgi:protein TonB
MLKFHALLAGLVLAGLCVFAPVSRAAGPEQDAQAGYRKSIAAYQGALAQMMERYKRYPAEAMAQNKQGIALLHGTIGADGRLEDAKIEHSSGHADLDEQAVVTLRRAKVAVPVPADLRGKPFEVHVRVVYTLDKDGAHQHGEEPGPTHTR